jgi:hypothetical protein
MGDVTARDLRNHGAEILDRVADGELRAGVEDVLDTAP